MTKTLSIEGLQTTIGYLFLLSFCPPERILEFKQAGAPLRAGLALRDGLAVDEYFERAVPEACRRIAAFHQRSKNPDQVVVDDLTEAARLAHANPVGAAVFEARMTQVTASPERAKLDKRLRPEKGCQFCAAPCRYGYFVLVTDPNFDLLHKLLQAEAGKPTQEQDPLKAAWSFATGHLWRALGTEQGYISASHLGGLAYCLLSLGMAQSRYPLPEEQYHAFQQTNQTMIQNWPRNGR